MALLAAMCAGGLAAGMPQAWAQPAPATANAPRSYQIAAGSLADALTQFARSAGVVLSFDPALVRGRRSDGLDGAYSVGAGFARILSGSGLQARAQSGNTWTLLQVAAPAGDTPTLAPVTVSGMSDSAITTVGYVATVSASATKTDTPLIETPQSVSVVTREQITEQGAQTLNQVLRYTAGVATESRGATATRLDQFSVRGFQASSYLDGLRVFGGRDALPQVDTYRLERVDVLKGPASVMYGQGGPGGVVNQVSKRPLEETLREVEVQVGNYDYRRANFDFGGPVDEDGKFLYRLVGSGYMSDGQVKDTKERRYFVSPAFTWKPSSDTTLTDQLPARSRHGFLWQRAGHAHAAFRARRHPPAGRLLRRRRQFRKERPQELFAGLCAGAPLQRQHQGIAKPALDARGSAVPQHLRRDDQ
jgi:iron complex outermembrane receptor protein